MKKTNNDKPLPLKGIRIIDLATFVAAPFAASNLKVRITLLCKKKKFAIVEFQQGNKWTILKDKKILTNKCIKTI